MLSALFGTAFVGGLLQPRTVAAAALRRDPAGRVLVDVAINGRGPFHFLLDTGAAVSAVSDFLARELRLPSAARTAGTESSRPLLGSTGSITAASRVTADSLAVDGLRVAQPVFAVIPGNGTSANEPDGVLGSDLLHGSCVDLAFDAGEWVIAAGFGSRRALRDVAIARELGPLLALRGRIRRPPPARGPTPRDAKARNVDLLAILDTGAQRSVGNEALARALSLDLATQVDAVVRGAGGQGLAARQLETPALSLGAVQLQAIPLLYADLPVFTAWRSRGRPALLLGMDLLGQLAHLRVDYRRRRVALAVDPP